MKVIKAIAFANGTDCPIAGQYLESFDFEMFNGRGYGRFTNDPDKAMKFATAGEAMRFWRTQSTTVPTRPDGKPNRPLTSTTIVVEDAT